jgi:hypothetical protein
MNALGTEICTDIVDELLALYCDWREESAGVQAAYERFSSAPASDRVLAFAAYIAALDREGSAAQAYEAQISEIRSGGTAEPSLFRHRRNRQRR